MYTILHTYPFIKYFKNCYIRTQFCVWCDHRINCLIEKVLSCLLLNYILIHNNSVLNKDLYKATLSSTYLTRRLKQISVSKRRAQTEYVIPFGMFRNRLHYRTVNDDQMLRSRLHRSTLSRIARIEQEGGAFQAYPVPFPASFSC